MDQPEESPELAVLQLQLDALLDCWGKLGQQIEELVKANKQPVHPPAALAAALVELAMGGLIPTFPLFGTPEDQTEHNLKLAVAMFRWGQVCYRNGIKYEDLLPCKCAEVDPDSLEEELKKILGD